MRRGFAQLSMALLVAACVTPEPKKVSEWPPNDWYLELRYHAPDPAGGNREWQRARFFADGLVVWTHSPRAQGGPKAGTSWFPVFERLCAYQLKPLSIRDLARKLDAVKIQEMAPLQGEPGGDDLAMVVIHHRAFATDRKIWIRGNAHGATARVLQLVNAFLPAECAFELPGMTAEPEPPHILRAPSPVDSVTGSLEYHQQLLRQLPQDLDLQLDVFSLALAADRRQVAEGILAGIDTPVQEGSLERLFPDGGRLGLAAQLRVLLGSEPAPP